MLAGKIFPLVTVSRQPFSPKESHKFLLIVFTAYQSSGRLRREICC